jgi:UDP-3-O-[3-hydroxymyristoyl] glucosamine N-acyltransferase
MKFTAEQIAIVLEGKVVGNPSASVSSFSKIEEGMEGTLTFLANPKYESYIYTTEATITIVNETFVPENDVKTTMILVEDAYMAFTKLLTFYDQARKDGKVGIEQPSTINDSSTYGSNFYLGSFSYIGSNVVIGKNVKIYPNCFVGDDVVLGDNVTLYAGTKIYHECIIGNNCIFHSGVIIGSDGFGFAPNTDGSYVKIPQIGNVIIEDNVEIGASTTIDRATMGSTIIREGVKLDNQIQIAHNVEIGENTVIAAQTGVAGSTKIGKNCVIGGQVGFAGHIVVGNNVRIQAQSGVGRNVKDNEILQGSPAFTYNEYSKSYVHFRNLTKIVAELDDIKKTVNKNK